MPCHNSEKSLAAHAFCVECHCGSGLKHGDMSVLSLHATKVFNTFEGGAIICPDIKAKLRIDQLKNFGDEGETSVIAPGINGKMSEFNAALGLLQLDYIDAAMLRRKKIDEVYRECLATVEGIECLGDSGEAKANYAHFLILVGGDYGLTRDELYTLFKKHDVHTRRYFYPLNSDFPMYRSLSSSDPHLLPAAGKAASEVLCLPIYPDLSFDTVRGIAGLIAGQARS